MSSTRTDPQNQPAWRALHREASLVRQLIGAGTTALGRASYGNGLGDYYTAFFGLSIGIERLAKLILVADHALEHSGALPDGRAIRHFGHDLAALVDRADQIAIRRNLNLEYKKPVEAISWAALRCLKSFADASEGRYANFEAIGNSNFNPSQEPVERWWREVVEPILAKHYRGSSGELRVKTHAQIIDAMLSSHSHVSFTTEAGDQLSDIVSASERTGQTKWAQKYGRFYTLCIVRWLSDIFHDLARDATYNRGLDILYAHWEFFDTYRQPDNFLLTRKTWPLK